MKRTTKKNSENYGPELSSKVRRQDATMDHVMRPKKEQRRVFVVPDEVNEQVARKKKSGWELKGNVRKQALRQLTFVRA